MGRIKRLLTGAPKCNYCKEDAVGYVDRQPVCARHRRLLRQSGGKKSGGDWG